MYRSALIQFLTLSKLFWFSLINISVFASVPTPEKIIEKKPIERKKPTKLHVDLADKETCSDKQRYESIITCWFLYRYIYKMNL